MKVGDRVMFSDPQTEDEALEVFTVLECRGDRVLVEFDCAMPIRPTFVYLIAEMKVVNESSNCL